MYYLLFTFYFLAFCILINRVPFIKNAALGSRVVTGLFLLKVAAGLLLGWVSATWYPQGNDYWNLNRHGQEEYQLLVHQPKEFFSNLFYSHYDDKYGGFFNAFESYWKDLTTNLILKVLAFFNIMSRGNYYINSLFFNFLGFFGHVALYRVFFHIYRKKWAVITGCFLLPSVLYFTSGIHKDTIVFTMLGFYCFALYFSIRDKITFKRILLFCISAIVLLFIRNYVLVALAPATLALFVARKKTHPLKIFALVYGICLLVVVAAEILLPGSPPLKIISQRQWDFFELKPATSQMAIDSLHPNLTSFARNAPSAIAHALSRPYIWESHQFLFLIALELIVLQLLFLYRLTRPSVLITYKPFIYFGIFFSLTLLLFAGYVVPNAGSLVRYRSIYLPFLVIPILAGIWPKQRI